MSKWYLSKSKLLSGAQCAKRLYLEINRPELSEVSAAIEQRFAAGHRVGEVARTRWPDGILIKHDVELREALRETQKVLVDKAVPAVFESTFEAGGVLVRNDILERTSKGMRLVEVKASTSVKDYHYLDVAIQVWVLRQAGIDLTHIELAHINSDFVYPGNEDYSGLFTFVDVRKEVEGRLNDIPELVDRLRTVLADSDEPNIAIGPQCHNPFDCPFLNHCTPPQPDFPVSLLPRGGNVAKALLADGYHDLREVPPGRLFNPTHERVRRVTQSGKPELLPGARCIIEKLPYPRYFMDFETVQFAVPIWKDSCPYEKLPFQWSCEIETADGSVRHTEFLDTEGHAPMEEFCRALLECIGPEGTIFVYNASFEKSVLHSLAQRFPKYAKSLTAMTERIVDLLPLTREHYYHPALQGSWSLKAVLPAIAPHLSYENLGEVQDAGAAPAAYMEIIDKATPDARRESLITDLRRYCERDTLAMVEIVKFISV